ncbi:MAG TPA: hypothetical protein VIS03_18995 [Kiloniellaceae bacterium]
MSELRQHLRNNVKEKIEAGEVASSMAVRQVRALPVIEAAL